MNLNLVPSSVVTATLAALAVFGSSAGAVVVNIDFNSTNNGGGTTYVGGAIAGDPAGANAFWNGISNNTFGPIDNLSATNLLDSTGVATEIDFTIVTHGGGYSGTGNDLLNDYLYINSSISTTTFTLSGLDPGLTYNVYIYSMGDNAGQGGAFTLGPTTLTTSASPRDGTTFVEGNNYVVFSAIAPDVAGNVVVGWALNGDPNGSGLNGLQIEIVPEPSTGVMLLAGLAGLGACSRRKRA